MRSVHELSQEELEELQQSYFYQLLDAGDEEVLGDIDTPTEIPISSIVSHYEDILFVDEDFFCNL